MMFVIFVWHGYNHYYVEYAVKILIWIWTIRCYICLGQRTPPPLYAITSALHPLCTSPPLHDVPVFVRFRPSYGRCLHAPHSGLCLLFISIVFAGCTYCNDSCLHHQQQLHASQYDTIQLIQSRLKTLIFDVNICFRIFNYHVHVTERLVSFSICEHVRFNKPWISMM